MSALENRRPIRSRGSAWAQGLASALARGGASPDLISALSVAFAAAGGAMLLWSGAAAGAVRVIALILAMVCIQMRLVCNLIDGMVAVEHGQGSSAGPIWNELPDRFADVLFLACAGYAAVYGGASGGDVAGWLATAGALITAYVRELGRGLGFPADFSGPMAKPHRMAALTLAAGVSVFEPLWGWRGQALLIGLSIIALGTLVTVARRVMRLAHGLHERRPLP